MLIDCDRCEMRNVACSDCVVNVLLGSERPEIDGAEERAIGVLADAGLVPPLRLTVATGGGSQGTERRLSATSGGDQDWGAAREAVEKKIDKTWPRGLPPMRSAG